LDWIGRPGRYGSINFKAGRRAGETGNLMENRELSMDDYLAMFSRRMKVILIPALLAPLAGFAISYAFPAKYTSQSLVLVEAAKIPDAVVQQVFTEDLTQHIATIQQQVLSANRLRPMIDRLGLAKNGQNLEDVQDEIRLGMTIEPVVTDLSEVGLAGRGRPGQSRTPVPGFYVMYTAPNAREAQQICTDLTSNLLEEDLKSREDVTQGTTLFLTKQVEDAKQNLDELDKRLAAFKDQHMGQLPGDEDNNMKILMGLNSQLDANSQTLNRATQDKAYTESLLAQQVSTWKTSQSANNPQTLQQQLSQLQAQLIDLQGKYTDDHPDVIKTRADIAEVKKKLAEVNDAAGKSDSAADKESGSEPPEIKQLRLQIHQYQDLIAQTTRDQKKLQEEIAVYQSRVASSPAVEEQYKELARDYDNAQKVYQDDLAKQSTSKMATQAEQQQQGEQMVLLDPANLPDSPSFPNRLFFAGGGLGAGLMLGLGLALWLELRDKCIRTEADAESALGLPMLVAVPWVGETAGARRNGNGYFWNRKKQPEEQKENARV
jgi:polysaccharide chain length determinant protein (PEP-CTERM system associated)